MAAKHPFRVGKQYRRRDIYRIIGIPEDTKGGNWDTGYNRHGKDWFLFCNLSVPGRTGHDYSNEFVADDLRWFGKTRSKIGHSSIQMMLGGEGNIYIFTRTNDKAPFIFAGTARPKRFVDSTPVEVIWQFLEGAEERCEVLPEEVVPDQDLYEGATKMIRVNVYERNSEARRLCVEHYGTRCKACEVDLVDVYGELARDFIHVHHVRPVSEIDAEYRIDPVEDLVPVCPNCHAMLHRRKPPLGVDELKTRLMLPKNQKGKAARG